MNNDLTIIVATGSNGAWIRKDAGGVKRWWNQTKRKMNDLGQGVSEKTNLSRMVSEKMFESYHDQMQQLRDTDQSIREWSKDLDNSLDRALDANKKGKMLDVLYWLSQVNSRLKLIGTKAEQLSSLRDEQLEEFYGDREHPLEEDYFHSDESRLANPNEKTAGVMDDIGRWVTKRKMENMYKKRLAEQKAALRVLVSKTKSIVGTTDTLLDRMAGARASGNIEAYITDLARISHHQKEFENTFRDLYDRHFKQMVDRVRQREEAQKPLIVSREEQKTDQLPSIFDEADPQYGDRTQVGDTLGPQHTVPGTPNPEALTPVAPEFKLEPSPAEHELPPTLLAPQQPKQDATDEPNPQQLNLFHEGPAEEIKEPANILTMEPTTISDPPPAMKPKYKKPAVPRPPKAPKPDKIIDSISKKNAHILFYNKLSQAAQYTVDPKELVGMILSYSEQIDGTDSEESLRLLAIAEGILDAQFDPHGST